MQMTDEFVFIGELKYHINLTFFLKINNCTLYGNLSNGIIFTNHFNIIIENTKLKNGYIDDEDPDIIYDPLFH